MIRSAGLLIIVNDRILLVKQKTNSSQRYLSIPKGEVADGESLLTAAIRETYEETGLDFASEKKFEGPFFLCYSYRGKVYKEVYYYVIRMNFLPDSFEPKDTFEIESVNLYCYDEAEEHLFVQQLSILSHVDTSKISDKNLQWLLQNNYLRREKHPFTDFYIYNYTDKCKIEGYWNETTLWSRGLILDRNNNVIARPLKKFFEYEQLNDIYKKELPQEFSVYDKLDGSLGILYWYKGLPFITTRGSFVSYQAYHATQVLYRKYSSQIHLLDENITYFFEIIYPQDRHIINYGDTDDIFLIGAYDNKNRREIEIHRLLETLSFQTTKKYDKKMLPDLLKEDVIGREGYVILFENGKRIKIKYPSYKKLFSQIKLYYE